MDKVEIERIERGQYGEGKRIIDYDEEARQLLKKLEKKCPHVPREELIKLFRSVAAGTKMIDTAVTASAHIMEYNATHPSPEEKGWFESLFSDIAKKIVEPEKVMGDEELYKSIIEVISDIEERYDDGGGAPMPVIKAAITSFLKDRESKFDVFNASD